MPRKWKGKWFKNNSGVKPARQGKGRGRSRGLRTQAPTSAVVTPKVVFQRAQQPPATPAAPSDRRRRRRPQKRTGGQK
ncbi:MAG TPA: hypothetical protein VJM46_01785 [Candidatus Saccharimonadales bacterium]|nr:hypothetical protein [Candidatus Saccharimonadales bacterium]